MTWRVPTSRKCSSDLGTSRPAEMMPGAGEVAWATSGTLAGSAVAQPGPINAASSAIRWSGFIRSCLRRDGNPSGSGCRCVEVLVRRGDLRVCERQRRHVCIVYLGRRHHLPVELRSEEHTSELQSLMRKSYAVF